MTIQRRFTWRAFARMRWRYFRDGGGKGLFALFVECSTGRPIIRFYAEREAAEAEAAIPVGAANGRRPLEKQSCHLDVPHGSRP